MKRTLGFLSALTLAVCSQGGCGANNSPGAGEPPDGQGSEIATSVVSGALNNTDGSALGWNSPRLRARQSTFDRALEILNPVGVAWAATWTCSGGSLTPPFAGPASDPYSYTPVSCSVTWKNGKTASSAWDGSFILNYGTSCDSQHPFIGHQAAGCSLTRTTGADGNTRTLTGPQGNSYSITHNTNGADTGYDATVAPAPSDDGVVVTCGTSGCDSDGTLVINGSHLTGTVTTAAGRSATLWDHTVTGDPRSGRDRHRPGGQRHSDGRAQPGPAHRQRRIQRRHLRRRHSAASQPRAAWPPPCRTAGAQARPKP